MNNICPVMKISDSEIVRLRIIPIIAQEIMNVKQNYES